MSLSSVVIFIPPSTSQHFTQEPSNQYYKWEIIHHHYSLSKEQPSFTGQGKIFVMCQIKCKGLLVYSLKLNKNIKTIEFLQEVIWAFLHRGVTSDSEAI